MFQFFDKIIANLKLVEDQERQHILALTDLLYQSIKDKKSIYVFGAGHAALISQEMFFRAGGCMLFNPIFARDLSLDNEPVVLTSYFERLDGYGKILAQKVHFKKDDVLIVHSVSGRNSVGIDLALSAKAKGSKVVVITNLNYSKQVTSRHPSQLRLFEVADLVLDNHGEIGDAICELQGSEQKVAASSTIIAIAMLNEAITQLAQRLVDDGVEKLPYFYSAHMDGGDQKNQELHDLYGDQIHYRYK